MADSAPATIPTPEVEVSATAPIADLPSGSPIPSSKPSPVPRPRIPLSVLLAAVPGNVDRFLARLEKCLSTPSGIDTVMLFLCYTSKLASAVLSSLSQSALRRSAREWIALVATLPRGTTVVFSSGDAAAAAAAKTRAPPAAALALALSKRLAALSGLLSEARMILRLWALLGMYFWARSLLRRTFSSSPSPPPSKTALAIEYARLTLCVVFQGLENVAYLSSRGVLPLAPKQQGAAFRWSARFWAGYVGIELGRLLAERFGSGKDGKAQTAQERREWMRKTAKQLAWAPLTLHWGSDKGLVSEMTVGLLASIPGIIQLGDLWASTA